MKPWHAWPLGGRIRVLALVPVAVVTLLLTTFFLYERFTSFASELDIRGQMMAEQLVPASEYGLISGNREALSALMAPLMKEHDVLFVRIRDGNGLVSVERHKDMAREQAGDGRLRVYAQPVIRQDVVADDISSLATLDGQAASLAIGTVEVGMVTDVIVERQRAVLWRALLLAALVLLVTAFVAARTADALARVEEARASAEHASRAKSEFLAMMSHELRTPMNGVMGMLELMEHTPLDDEQKQYVDTARRSSEHLLVVIDDVLDFSRIEGGRLPIEQIEFDLGDLLQATVDGFAQQAALRNLPLALEADPVLRGVQVTSDPTRLRQVLVNLIGNALKFTERGRVTVRASGFVDVDRLQLVIDVEDTGIGIEPERIAQMFEPFRQADSSVSRRYGGTGLGLPIAQRLTQMLGGRIEVHSVPGHGSRFTLHFDLPARRVLFADGRDAERRQGGVAPAPAGIEQRLAGRRVLVVEDNQVSQRVAEGMLHSLDVEVDVAGDGEAALACLASRRYDLVLMDVQMPHMDGLEATRRLRGWTADRGGRTPVIALTAHAFAGERQRCLDAGMNGYLTKPFTRQNLRDAMTVALAAAQRPSSG